MREMRANITGNHDSSEDRERGPCPPIASRLDSPEATGLVSTNR
jgi:hypothetical protein